jgi:hypothetical protein
MPCFAMAKDIKDLILRRRVVLNEMNVYEFMHLNEQSNNRVSTISQASTKTSKFSEFLGTSPRTNKSSSNQMSSASHNQYETPNLAGTITSNPFHDNKFPVCDFFERYIILFWFFFTHLYN